VSQLFVQIQNGEWAQTSLLPSRGSVRVGSDRGCDVRLDAPGIAPEIAIIGMDPLTLEATVANARLNGAALPAGVVAPIEVGAHLQIGALELLIQSWTTEPARRISSHAYFEQRLDEECARATRTRSTFAMIRIRAEEGSVLVRLETAVVSTIRLSDIVSAYGPREYEILLPDTDEAGSQLVLGRLAENLAQQQTHARVGVAYFPRDGRSSDDLSARATPGYAPEPDRMLGPEMERLEKMVNRIAGSDINVLILGETGVGKEIIAERVHRRSGRAAGPFLRLNCAALAESLLESELFGYEKGAFTGAQVSKPGLLETAGGGTVFLDEIGELPITMQVKLLRVLEEREVLRVGGLQPRKIDVRFVAATNRDLEAEANRGTFRIDLYYRLDGATLIIPPLRDRLGEIEPLSRSLLADAARRMRSTRNYKLSSQAVDLLMAYRWPGNIRELRNVLERAVALCDGEVIGPEHLPVEKLTSSFAARSLGNSKVVQSSTPARGTGEVDLTGEQPDHERSRILAALNACAGNQSEAARRLGISRGTLINRIAAYGLPRPRKAR